MRGTRSRMTLERPYEFKIEELDIPIQGTEEDNKWFHNNLIPTFSCSPIHNITDKFLEREDYLLSQEPVNEN